jgi:hypothetical protein
MIDQSDDRDVLVNSGTSLPTRDATSLDFWNFAVQ